MEVATVRAAQLGDRVALAAIVDEFTPTVVGAAYGLCGDVDRTGDIAQEVFATMLVRIGDLREPSALPGWLMAVTRSVARRQRRAAPRPLAETPAENPEDVVAERDAAERVRRTVEALPPDERVLIALHYFAGHRLSDIAALCDLPMSTVKKRMRVARAHMRERIDMTQNLAGVVSPDPSDVIRMYTAMRSSDVARVAKLLDDHPELVDVRERWTRAEGVAHRLSHASGGTPLLRAVERGDVAMVDLLLARGADPDGACTCDGGERPLWVAAAQRETAIVRLLLARGADPDVTAFAGMSPLDVAKLRGYDEIVTLLGDSHAEVAATPSPDARRPGLDVDATGIKAIDLWCPLPASGLAHLTPGFGLGAVVLIAELSCRAARRCQPVVWTGFVPAPTDLRDMRHAIADAGLTDDIEVRIAPPDAPEALQVALLDEGIREAGDEAFLVVFTETGHHRSIEERLVALSQRPSLTLVVGPFDGSAHAPKRAGSPYRASIVFDVERARRHRWPAVGSESWSKAGDAAALALADHARAHMTDELDAYLCQPFFVAEHVTGRPGEVVPVDELRARVSALTPASSCPPPSSPSSSP